MRVPNVIKNVPILIVRAMPTLYYYGCYANESPPDQAKSRFLSYLKYFRNALVVLNEYLPDIKIEKIIEEADQIVPDSPRKLPDKIYDFSRRISQICQRHKEKLDHAIKRDGLNESLLELFDKAIPKDRILVIENQNDPDFAEAFTEKLVDKCQYEAKFVFSTIVDRLAEPILNSDFLIFTSAAPQSIHDNVEWLKTYNKPGLVLGNLKKENKQNQQIIRNGAWLRSRGVYVLFKIYTPLRLFTTIDKVFMRYLCQGN